MNHEKLQYTVCVGISNNIHISKCIAHTFKKLYLGYFRGVLWNISSLENAFGTVQYDFLLKNWANRSFPLFGERCKWIAQVANQKWAMWANCSGCSTKMSDHERFAQVAHFWAKNERFALKTNERVPSPGLNTFLVTLSLTCFYKYPFSGPCFPHEFLFL